MPFCPGMPGSPFEPGKPGGPVNINTENPWSKPEHRVFQRFSSNPHEHKGQKTFGFDFYFDKTKSNQLPVRNHD